MIKVLYSKISEKFWKDLSEFDKAQLFQLLFITAIAQLISILIFVSGIVKDSGQSNILCNAGLVMVASLALICVLNGKKNCVLYILFTLPVFIYAYNISDFINHPTDWYNV
ncbi:MAG: hypothetical protein PHG29_05765, partial [Prolixibacteraceae bacterium]|nr:hypothetical protein [Prolixibacteraceae bacterium]